VTGAEKSARPAPAGQADRTEAARRDRPRYRAPDLSAFNEIGLITVDQRTIGIKNAEALQTLRRLSPRSRGNRGGRQETIRTGESLKHGYTAHRLLG
jgi:hypothetical protein